jgi:hypothetical protein
MGAVDFTSARFPTFGSDGGGYESWFLRAADPLGGRAIWIRNTVHKSPGGPSIGSLWLTYFDGDGGPPVACKQSFEPADLLAPTDGDYVHVGGARIGPGVAQGSITTVDGEKASWDITFDTINPPAPGLLNDAMYGWPVPRAKPVSIHPDTTLAGTVTVGGRAIQVDGWRGCIGHNWGPEHTPEWVWMQTSRFTGAPGAWFDGSLGRVKVGPVLTPWLGSAWLALDGTRHRLGTALTMHATRMAVASDGCRFTLRGSGISVEGHVQAPPPQSIAWWYSDPSDSGRHVVHCSIATLTLEVKLGRSPGRTLVAQSGAGYEHGSSRTPVGVPEAGFPDP